jgi:hypothetical protein
MCITLRAHSTDLIFVHVCRSSEYALAKEAFDGKQARQAAVLDKIAPQQLIAALAAAAEALDTESEELNDRYRLVCSVEICALCKMIRSPKLSDSVEYDESASA